MAEEATGGKGEGAEESPSFESSAFDTLERDFQQVLTELVGDKSLERFRQVSARTREGESCFVARERAWDGRAWAPLVARGRPLVANNHARDVLSLSLWPRPPSGGLAPQPLSDPFSLPSLLSSPRLLYRSTRSCTGR